MSWNSNVPIINYQKAVPSQLLRLTEKLYEKNYFESYLTPNQLIILDRLISVNSQELKLKIWEEIFKGNVKFDVQKIEEELDLEDSNKSAHNSEDEQMTENSANNNNNEAKNDDVITDETEKHVSENIEQDQLGNEKNEEQDDLSTLDLDEFKQHINGAEFIGNLSLKLRYVLWQCVVDLLYNSVDELEYNKIIDLDEEQRQDILDFILQDIDEHEVLEEKSKFSSNDQNTSSNAKSIRNDEEDDEYDDASEDDYDKEDETGDDKEVKEKMENSDDIEVHTSEDGFLVLEIKISKDILTNSKNINTDRIIENWDKIYHSYEYDRDTMMKRLRLEKSDQMIESFKGKKRSRSQSMSINEGDGSHEDAESRKATEIDQTVNNENFSTTEDTISKNISGEMDENKHESKRARHDSISLPVNLGTANLSMKYLMAAIHDNKSKLKMTDYELKHLITDVRKNRSKWGSDDRIGQEELYEACEKVVLELRNYTEHSTPFLNKVNKREAPNYHQIIKKSMDLNTVLKKLKTFQYNSKQEFVDDIMLIWKNCLTYNSDPSHFLRSHAIAMQKKSLQLTPLIPNITIRNRADVEKELEANDKDKGDDEEEEEEEVAGLGRKGLTMGVHKPTHVESGDGDKIDENDENLAKEDKKDDANADNTESTTKISGENEKDNKKEKDGEKGFQEKSEETSELSKPKHVEGEIEIKQTEADNSVAAITELKETDRKSEVEIKNLNLEEKVDPSMSSDSHVDQLQKKSDEVEKPAELHANNTYDSNDDEEEEDDDEDMEDTHTYFAERDDDKDDIEISFWKSVTAKARADICVQRTKYFADGTLNKDAAALLKNPQKMKSFQQLFTEFKDQKEQENARKSIEQQSIMKNGFGAVIKQEENEQMPPLVEQKTENDENVVDKSYDDLDLENSAFLEEYDVVNNLPNTNYKGISQDFFNREEDAAVKNLLDAEVVKPSIYLKSANLGLTPKMVENIKLIEEIRQICHKLSLIRLLQNPNYQSSKVTSKNLSSAQEFVDTSVNDDVDLDPVSRLQTRNYRNDPGLIRAIMNRNVSKIAMANGFKSTQRKAINTLTELSGEYLSNLIRTLKFHKESNTLNKKTSSEILCITLLKNGIDKPDDLFGYYESEFIKKTKKLKDLKEKLKNFLKEILRPTLKELSERNFDDQSHSFVTGDFASEVTGEDFFGFKELGLEKEFGELAASVPLNLLTFQFQSADAVTNVQVKKIQPEEHDNIHFSKVTKLAIKNGEYWQTLTPLLWKSLEKTAAYTSRITKMQDQTAIGCGSQKELSAEVLLEDEKMVFKSKPSSKPRVPPTGKLNTTYKKKSITDAFFLPEEGDSLVVDNPSVSVDTTILSPEQKKINANLDSFDSASISNSFLSNETAKTAEDVASVSGMFPSIN